LPTKDTVEYSMNGAEKMKKRIPSFVRHPKENGNFLRHSFYYYTF